MDEAFRWLAERGISGMKLNRIHLRSSERQSNGFSFIRKFIDKL